MLSRRVFEEFKKNLGPLKDCKTRWNRALTMFNRFYEIRKSIGLTLIDLGGKISFLNAEWEMLSALINCLKSIETAVKELCGAHVNLLEADIALSMLLYEIEKLKDHPFGEKMFTALVIRINERRNFNSIILGYLEHGKINPNVHPTMQLYSSISDTLLIDILVGLYTRTNPIKNTNVTETETELIVDDDEADQEPDFAVRLKMKMKTLYQPIKKTAPIIDIRTKIIMEIKRFDGDGVRGPILEFIYQSLMSM